MLLSILVDAYRFRSLALRIESKTNILFIRLEEEASPKIVERIIARGSIVEGIVIRGIPVI